jgi:hypothetical protein
VAGVPDDPEQPVAQHVSGMVKSARDDHRDLPEGE